MLRILDSKDLKDSSLIQDAPVRVPEGNRLGILPYRFAGLRALLLSTHRVLVLGQRIAQRPAFGGHYDPYLEALVCPTLERLG